MGTEEKLVVIAGASGLIGGHLIIALLAQEDLKVLSLVRRHSGLEHKRLSEHIVDFADTASFPAVEKPRAVFCCLGSTMKKAGSREAFRQIDHQFPLNLATWAARHGAEQFHLVSAMGADPSSGIFYNQIKGETERDIAQLPLPTAVFYRPSLLLGQRDEKRTGEKLAQISMPIISPFMLGPLKAYRPIQGKTVASAMLKAFREPVMGKRVLKSDQIQQLSQRP